ncbi:uncharacterized protein LOC124154349 isoform X2 [Ischnura elegans]|uniref:uncharacterized protein LOC124154349 isoform X2 n=1 Tax=Ischnura elegans TaxID=197161 RepID=UPI001ED88E41|nr:uncharacterized protein LOC124154349 isoform X2 [Ischnura elegans]
MTSLLVTVIVAACVTLPVHGFDELRIDDIKLLEILMLNLKLQEVIWTDFKKCIIHKIERSFERDPEGLYPDSPCPHCSAMCSIKDEMKECLPGNLENTKLNIFVVQMCDLVLSSVCRPDVMQLFAEPKILATIAETWANCAVTIALDDSVLVKFIRETPDIDIEEKMCWVIVKSTQCLKNIMKEQMLPLYDVVSSIANEIPYSRLCGEYDEKMFIDKGHDEF